MTVPDYDAYLMAPWHEMEEPERDELSRPQDDDMWEHRGEDDVVPEMWSPN